MKRICSVFLFVVLIIGLCACGQSGPTWQEQYDLGLRYLEEGNYEEAILAFNTAIEIDPKRAEAYISLADTYIAMGDYDSAKAILEQALEQVDNIESIQEKLDSVLELISNAEIQEDVQSDNGEEDMVGPDGTESPDRTNLSDQTEDIEAGTEEVEDRTDAQEPVDTETPVQKNPVQEAPIEQPVQDLPVAQPIQLPQSYTEYRYAVDAVGAATVWDLHQSLMNSGLYVFEYFDDLEGLALYARYLISGSERSLSFDASVPWDECKDLDQDGVISYNETLSQLGSNIVESITNNYAPVSMEISPVFRDSMTYNEIIQACDNNGYSYEQSENPSYSEIYLSIELGNRRHISFTWHSAWAEEDITEQMPLWYTVSCWG